MPFLLLLILALICLQSAGTPAATPSVTWPAPFLGWTDALAIAVVTWTGIAVLVVAAGVLADAARRRLAANPGNRHMLLRRYGRFRRYHGYALIACYLAVLYLAGWGWIVQKVALGMPGLVPFMELLILAPFLTGLMLSWALLYTMERAAHDTAPLADDCDPFPGRAAYVVLQMRHNLLLIVPPLLLLVIRRTVFCLVPSLESNSLFTPFFAMALLLGIFVAIPVVLRLLLGLKPLPPSPLRDRLLATAHRLRFRCNDILLWNTRNNMANAMVTGPLPILRYVVLTDRLVREMSPEEVEAVFGHEIGHIKHHHMLFYFGFLVASLVVMAGAWEGLQKLVQAYPIPWAPDLGDWLESADFLGVLPMVALLATYVFVVFGFLSRRCERQADIYGCRTVSPEVFIEALEKVARLNGIHRDRPGWLSSWQHSTIARRVDFLQRMGADPALEPRFQRRVWLIKWSMLLSLAMVIVTLYATLYVMLGGNEVWQILMHF